MDGQHVNLSARFAFFLSHQGRVLAAVLCSMCLSLLSGCAVTKSVLLKPLTGDTGQPSATAANASSDCVKPDCAAPGSLVVPQIPMTAMPVPQNALVPQTAVPPAAPELPQLVPPVSIPLAQDSAQIPSPVVATNVAQSFHGAQSVVTPTPVVTMIPPGWKLVPDAVAVAPEQIAEEPCVPLAAPYSPYRSTDSPATPVANAKLLQCEQQMVEMTEKIMGLQNTTEVTKQAMLNMAVEQMRLRNENEALKQRADETHREFIQSIDSISQFIDEVIPPETLEPPKTPVRKPVPQQSTRRTTKRPEQVAVLLPSVE